MPFFFFFPVYTLKDQGKTDISYLQRLFFSLRLSSSGIHFSPLRLSDRSSLLQHSQQAVLSLAHCSATMGSITDLFQSKQYCLEISIQECKLSHLAEAQDYRG